MRRNAENPLVAFIVSGNKKEIKLALPKGRIYDKVVKLLKNAGFTISGNGRSYRPKINDNNIKIKILKARNIPRLVELGSQDIAFTGNDWVVEQSADVLELIDLKFDPVKIVAAIPKKYSFDELKKKKKVVVASEYENLTKKFLEKNGFDYVYLRTFGATEVFPPDDADMIVDNTSTGTTLKQNGLEIVDTLLESSTRMIANKQAMQDEWKRKKIDCIVMLLKSVLEGKKRVYLEMNVSEDNLNDLVKILPCMKSPTISKLYGADGFAVKVAVEKNKVAELIPILKEKGATDILEFKLSKVVV
jgi:ATP phosphoribosyltransferase